MKEKIIKFFNELGTVFYNPGDIKSNYDDNEEFTILPEGTYLIVDIDNTLGTVLSLYDIKHKKNVSFEIGWVDEDTEFDIIDISPLEVVNMALDSKTKNILQLASDGWEINRENKYFDLTPEIKKFETLAEMKRILERKENQEEEKLYNNLAAKRV